MRRNRFGLACDEGERSTRTKLAARKTPCIFAAHPIYEDMTATTSALLSSARLEIMLVLWRVGQAIPCLAQDAEDLQRRRWSAGIARELVSVHESPCSLLIQHKWTAIRAMGVCAAACAVRGAGGEEAADEDVGKVGPENCRPLTMLLAHVHWVGRGICFPVETFDRPAFLRAVSCIEGRRLGKLATEHGYPKWWTWDGHAVGGHIPAWWANPPAHVVSGSGFHWDHGSSALQGGAGGVLQRRCGRCQNERSDTATSSGAGG